MDIANENKLNGTTCDNTNSVDVNACSNVVEKGCTEENVATQLPLQDNLDDKSTVQAVEENIKTLGEKHESDDYYNTFVQNFVPNNKKRLFYKFVKRSFDIIISFFALVLLSPLFLVVAIAIKCDSKGPVIFAQERLGRNKKVFKCYKFRSMTVSAPKNKATSLLKNHEQYLTKVGRFLRATSIDELPQLINVFTGKMSLIGYRPLIVAEKNCNALRDKLNVFSFRPGISGYAQVNGRDNVYYKNKAMLDAIYVKNADVLMDLKIIAKTFIILIKKDGNKDAKKKNKNTNKDAK